MSLLDALSGGGEGGGNPALLLGSPLFTRVAFHPRRSKKGGSDFRGAIDDTYVVRDAEKKIEIGYRLYPHPKNVGKSVPILVHFHGNAELVSESDHWAPHIVDIGFSVLSVDFRGYGWGSDRSSPSLLTMCSDAEVLFRGLGALSKKHDVAFGRVVVYGRSIGSLCAVHLASVFHKQCAGLVVEAGLFNILTLPMVSMIANQIIGPAAETFLGRIPDVFTQGDKMKGLSKSEGLRVLILHGTSDRIVPYEQGKQLFEACGVPGDRKQMCDFRGRGHNDLHLHSRYAPSRDAFLAKFCGCTTAPNAALATATRGGIEDEADSGRSGEGGGSAGGWCRCS
eukprot:g4467.t1